MVSGDCLKPKYISIRILDDTKISICSVKFCSNWYTYDLHKIDLFEYFLSVKSAVKNPRIPNTYLFDVSKNEAKNEVNGKRSFLEYNIILYDEYKNIIDCEYTIMFYRNLD